MLTLKRKRVPEVFQIEASECGAACLSMVLSYHGLHVPMEELREACGVSRNGCNAKYILLAAKEYGLMGKAYRIELDQLKNLPTPAILHWNQNHFVVLERMEKKRAILCDPAQGRRRVTMEEVDESFTGIALIFEPLPEFRPEKNENGSFIKELLLRNKEAAGYLFVSGLALILLGLLSPVFTQVFMDEVILGGEKNWSLAILSGLGLVILGSSVTSLLRSMVLSRVSLWETLDANHALMERMLKLPLSFFEQRFLGDLASREETNERIYTFFAGSLTTTILEFLQVVFYLLLMFLYSPLLALLSLGGVALNLVVLSFFFGQMENISLKYNQDRNHLMGILCSGLAIFDSLKASGAENDFATMLMGNYAATTESDRRLNVLQKVLNVIPSTVSSLLTVLVLILGGGMVLDGTLSAGAMTAFIQVLGSFLAPVNNLLSLAKQLQSIRADMAIKNDSQNAKVDPMFIPSSAKDSWPEDTLPTGQVSAKGLVFGYDRYAQPLLKNFSFQLSPGSSLGIIGESGSGKSTVAKLVSGLLLPWKGTITMDGVPLMDIPAAVRNTEFSMVSQKESFFSASLRDNLSLWDKSISDKKIYRALQDALALDLVSHLPGGLDFHLMEGGKNFSGGERQQLALARALVHSPALLILDEATSAMDVFREQKIMENLRTRGCTLIIIAHRLSTIKDCDLILVMDKGEVKEAGKHRALMEKNGIYCQLYGKNQ